jgi:hypothetical protein
MKGNLNPEAEPICPPLGDPNGKPDQEVPDFQTPNLTHINARAPEVS